MLNSTKIKVFISNPDVYLSHVAVGYFDDSLSEDEEILNLVLDRCSSISEDEQIMLLSEATHLKVNKDAFNKIVEKLPTASPKLRFAYEGLLLNVDISLINSSSALDIEKLTPETKIAINQRLNISTHSTAKLLQELLNFSLANDTKYIHEFNHEYGNLITDELNKRQDLDEEKIIEALSSSTPEEYGYYECYLLSLAGKRKLHTLIPVFINGLGLEDLVSEESMNALLRIGTRDIIEKIVSRYAKESDSFKIYASGVLENIKIKESEEAALKLLKKEKDITIKTLLAGALCRLFSTEAIPEIKELIKDEYDLSMLNLEEFAYINCVFNGLDIPEMKIWKESFDEEKDFYFNPPQLNLPVVSESKVGRNDPCPCGSGKKYKKCCGKN